MQIFEVWEDPKTHVRFYFSYSSSEFTTGVMVIPGHTELPKHNRPQAIENLVQVSGTCNMTVFDESGAAKESSLEVGSTLIIPKGHFHIHANRVDAVSFTLFKAVGDITAVVENIRQTFTPIKLKQD